MAIPFYEDETVATAANHSQITDGDQVDGPAVFESYDQVDYEAPPPTVTNTATTTNASSPPSTEEQLLAWKLLALTMCKVLRQFYLQQKKQQPPSPGSKSSKLTATVQIQPQAQ